MDLGPNLASRVQFDQLTTAGPRIVLSSSDKRVSLTFFPPDTGAVTLSNDSPASFGQGIVLTPSSFPVKLHLKRDGDCVQREWFALYTGVFAPVSWIEAFG